MASPAVISFANYGWETTFGTATTSFANTFGHGTRITTLSRKNNIQKVYGLGSRNASALVPTKYECAKTVEFVLSNPWFLRSFLGTTTTTSSAPYVHTFTESNTVESFSVHNEIASDTPYVAQLLGCKANAITISAAVGELARIRMDVMVANEQTGSTSSAVAETFDVYTFANGTLELPDSSTIADVQNVELTLAQNAEGVWGMGSRTAQKIPVKARDYSARVTLAFEARTTMIDKLFGATTGPNTTVAESATLVLTFDNGLTGANTRKIELTFTGVKIDEDSLPQDPTALILEDVTLHMRSLTAVASDNTSTVS